MLQRTIERGLLVGPAAEPVTQQYHRKPGMGARIIGIGGERLLEQPPRLRLCLQVADLGQRGVGAQHAFVGDQGRRRLAFRQRRA
jgi:hypothetical protein